MSMDLELENRLIQLRARLNDRKIKLWETPYLTAERNIDEAKVLKLAEQLGPELGIPTDLCLQGLKALQRNALEKLQSKDEFQRMGIATVKTRAPTQAGSNREFDLKVKITALGSHLCELIGQRLSLEPRKLKLVCAGKIITNGRSLQEQKVTNGSTIMALVMAHSEEEAKRECSTYDRVYKIRADAEMLINENDSSNFLSIEDQSGNAIFLPKEEKKSLLMGLTLYEKGKAAMMVGNFEEALLLLLEADHDIRSCNSQLLDVIDNNALLNLDIVWCYLCLKNLNQLPDAEQRLKLCELKFQQSYGKNMQRVAAIRGEQSNERIALVRLHLLKAILYFYQNKRDDARTMFRVVETELLKLRIDDDCLSRLMECGYSMKECRAALRACSNDVEVSIEFIHNRRQTREANEVRSERERKLYKTIGHDASSGEFQRIKLELVDQLMEMGYPEELAGLALKNSPNDINGALNELETNKEGLQNRLLRTVSVNEELEKQLEALGFHSQIVQIALKLTANDYDRATHYLLTNVHNGIYSEALQRAVAEFNRKRTPETSDSSSTEEGTQLASNISSEKPSTSKRASRSCDPTDEAKTQENKRKKEMLDILFKSFSQDIRTTDEDSHLDLLLDEEAKLLEQYKQLLDMD
ncbi:NEDD8 ultimate buster 1-like [Anopheles marshallii]|uniref:NEDD8 ultimate buster 1-like n=1 Tax=Anopheles marshallii TaxID=1521116 RepID=UPI00237AA9DE|nr:NEDD8 ultimate buster 1-like [Anopheles marshallii]